MTVKIINDSTGPDKPVLTVSVFVALPRLGRPTDVLKPSTLKPALAVRRASTEMSNKFAPRQVRGALRI